MKKREISDIEKEECKLLKQLFNDRKKELGLSQAKIADLIGVTQAAINHYLNGTNALNASIASEFAKVLGVPVGSFSWRLEKEINEMSNSLIISGGVINGALHNNIGGVHNNTSYTLNQNKEQINLSEWVLAAREYAGPEMTQEKLAEHLGRTKANVSAMENGRSKPSFEQMMEIHRVTGYPLPYQQSAGRDLINGNQTNTSYTLNQNTVSKPTKEELSDADKHFLKSMPLLDIDIAVRHLANPDKDRTQIQGDGDRAATFIPHSGHTVGVRMADDVEFAGIKRGDILIVEPHIPPRDKDLVLICIDNTGYLRGMVGRLSIAIDGTHTFIYDGGSGVPLPDGAFITGVVVEVKRRLIPTDILLSRLDPDYNILQSKQRE